MAYFFGAPCIFYFNGFKVYCVSCSLYFLAVIGALQIFIDNDDDDDDAPGKALFLFWFQFSSTKTTLPVRVCYHSVLLPLSTAIHVLHHHHQYAETIWLRFTSPCEPDTG